MFITNTYNNMIYYHNNIICRTLRSMEVYVHRPHTVHLNKLLLPNVHYFPSHTFNPSDLTIT